MWAGQIHYKTLRFLLWGGGDGTDMLYLSFWILTLIIIVDITVISLPNFAIVHN